ncbi:MAG: dienelactone hydrolase family protein [Anaerolineae bacterium]|nr:dienelactone hydrolase family protein [Anaerolineae bacterium]
MAVSQPDGYLALPAAGTGPGVLVLHAWWGLNDTIKGVCERLAAEGFVAFAPDLYHGKVADTIAGAEALGSALDERYMQARAEIRDAMAYLDEQAGDGQRAFAVIGFSLGAFYALDLSNADPEHVRAAVVFYGTGAEDFSDSQASYLGHFAETDPYEPQPNVTYLAELLQQAGRPATFYTYPDTGHWFFEPDRTDAYDEEAATLAWQRTLDFLKAAASDGNG